MKTVHLSKKIVGLSISMMIVLVMIIQALNLYQTRRCSQEVKEWARNKGEQEADEKTEKIVAKICSVSLDTWSTGRLISKILFRGYTEMNMPRSQIYDLFLSAIQDTRYTSIWTSWKSNVFDEKDSLYKSMPGYGVEGRLATVILNDGRQISLEEYDPSLGSIFPQEQKLVMKEDKISFIIPILDKKEVKGVVGIDIPLPLIYSVIEKEKYEISIVTSEGEIISNKKPKEDTFEVVKEMPIAENLSWKITVKIPREELRIMVSKFEKVERMTLIKVIFASGFLLLLAVLILTFILRRSVVGPLRENTDHLNQSVVVVSDSSSMISETGRALAEGASEQAASIEEISSSLEEMSALTRLNASHANEADHLMKEVASLVEKAGQVIKELTVSMETVGKSSEETFRVIRTIDEIAFQTNLLALNAAIEAARAGESGAGFGIVADEVRNLAMRAAQAAQSTSSLIESTVHKIREGGKMADTTSESFSGLLTHAQNVSKLVSEIAAASREQAQGIEQIHSGMSQVDKITQRNVSRAEELVNSSETLNDLSRDLQTAAQMLSDTILGSRRKRETVLTDFTVSDVLQT